MNLGGHEHDHGDDRYEDDGDDDCSDDYEDDVGQDYHIGQLSRMMMILQKS